MKLKDLQPTTEIENTKTWELLKINDYFYVTGFDDTGDEYAYVSRILRKSYDDLDGDNEYNWICQDIWDVNLNGLEEEWTMEKFFFVHEHISFHIIDMKKFPEYLL